MISQIKLEIIKTEDKIDVYERHLEKLYNAWDNSKRRDVLYVFIGDYTDKISDLKCILEFLKKQQYGL